MYKNIIEAIKTERKEKSLSVRAMALDLGLNQQTLDRILKGQRSMGAKSFEIVMQARPHWWILLNGSVQADNPDGQEPDRSNNK